MTGDGRVQAVVWAQIEATWYSWDRASLRTISVRRITQRRPRRPEPGSVLVKLTITLPRGAFVPPILQGLVDVPPEHVETVPATVVSEEP
jgi:hypothetical protein